MLALRKFLLDNANLLGLQLARELTFMICVLMHFLWHSEDRYLQR